jgi:ferrochelatase
MDMTTGEKIGVVCFQLGGPDSPEAVEPFLYNLFCDPDIIDFPGAFLARRPLARLISSRRSGAVIERYRQIGGKSPIIDLTFAQAQALEELLNRSFPARVVVAMRYWHPFTGEAIEELKRAGCTRIVLLPLYPHYSKATTRSSMREWQRHARSLNLTTLPVESICCYHNHPSYIGAIAGRIAETFTRFSCARGDIDLVFSAHGVPASLIRKGDPYQLHIQETVRLVVERGNWGAPHHLCYQSKVGPAEWLTPSLLHTLHELASKGRKRILVVPIAFVTEHIETLHEINIEARDEVMKSGVEQFEMMPALNNHPLFIDCLADLVTRKVRGEECGLGTCRGVLDRHAGLPQPVLCPNWMSNALTK